MDIGMGHFEMARLQLRGLAIDVIDRRKSLGPNFLIDAL